jgi:hypothetical protein
MTIPAMTNPATTNPATTSQGTQPGTGSPGDLPASPFESKLLPSELALLAALEDGLCAIESALLSHNLELLENATARLARDYAKLKKMPPIAGPGSTMHSANGASQLRDTRWRVLHLGRVQAALLARMQRSLTAIANLLAGRSASYGPPAAVATLDVLEDSTGDYQCRA